MAYFLGKALLSGVIIAAVSELAKRNTLIAAVVASLPLTSLLAFVWLYRDAGDVQRIARLSYQIFWLVIPSLALFLALPWLIHRGFGFWPSLGLASALTVGAYSIMVVGSRYLGSAL